MVQAVAIYRYGIYIPKEFAAVVREHLPTLLGPHDHPADDSLTDFIQVETPAEQDDVAAALSQLLLLPILDFREKRNHDA